MCVRMCMCVCVCTYVCACTCRVMFVPVHWECKEGIVGLIGLRLYDILSFDIIQNSYCSALNQNQLTKQLTGYL